MWTQIEGSERFTESSGARGETLHFKADIDQGELRAGQAGYRLGAIVNGMKVRRIRARSGDGFDSITIDLVSATGGGSGRNSQHVPVAGDERWHAEATSREMDYYEAEQLGLWTNEGLWGDDLKSKKTLPSIIMVKTSWAKGALPKTAAEAATAAAAAHVNVKTVLAEGKLRPIDLRTEQDGELLRTTMRYIYLETLDGVS